jgi:hypothetical protein
MLYELYLKSGFGRRIRPVSSVAGMRRILGNLWTSIAGYGHGTVAPFPKPTVTTAPSISGAAGATTVGTLLTAVQGVFAGSGVVVTGQWMNGTTPIPGQTGLTLDTTALAADASITYKSTASNSGGSVESSSNAIVLTAAA